MYSSSAPDAAAVNLNGINILSANGVIMFFIKGNSLFLVMDQVICLKILLIVSFW